jgi:hypothetical protein
LTSLQKHHDLYTGTTAASLQIPFPFFTTPLGDTWRKIIWKGFEKKRLRPNRGTSPAIVWRNWGKPSHNWVRMANVPAEHLIEHTRLEGYLQTKLFGGQIRHSSIISPSNVTVVNVWVSVFCSQATFLVQAHKRRRHTPRRWQTHNGER